MFKLNLVVLASLAALTLGASASASASTAGWMLNKSMLSGSKGLMKKEPPPSEVKFSAAGAAGQCASTTLEGALIQSPNQGSATSITFNGCEAEEPCTLGSNTVTTVPVTLSEITLEGTLAVRGKIKPSTKNVFATVQFLGATCALLGVQPITGAVKVLDLTGQHEAVLQQVLVDDNKELKLGSSELHVHFTIFLSPEALEEFSFL